MSVDQDVFRFDIAMHDSHFVGILERIAGHQHDGHGFVSGDNSLFEQLPEIRTINELHEQEIQVRSSPGIVNDHDARMVEFGQGLGLAGESLREARHFPDVRRKDFQCDETVKFPLARLVNGTHSPGSDEPEDLQLRENGC